MKYLHTLYKHARPYFLSFIPSLKDRGLTVHHSAISHGYRGPHLEQITTDYLRIGTNRTNWILITTGVHGVELFPGSAIQCRILEEIANQNVFIPEGVGVLFVHSVDPFGAVWYRHTNINNVDLNRNFIKDPARIDHITQHPEYLKAVKIYKDNEDYINPKEYSKYDHPRLRAAQLSVRYGKEEFLFDLSVGQRHNPKGLFYCGTSLEPELNSMLNNVQSLLGSNITLFHIDIQTGLGNAGDYTLVCTRDKDKKIITDLGEGNKLYHQLDEEPFKIAATGYVIDGLTENLNIGDHTGVVQNFGTLDRSTSFLALRNENIWHNMHENITAYSRGKDVKVNIEEYINHTSKNELLAAYCLANEQWEKQITQQGLELFKKALAYQASKSIKS